jgi:hypothetical protein
MGARSHIAVRRLRRLTVADPCELQNSLFGSMENNKAVISARLPVVFGASVSRTTAYPSTPSLLGLTRQSINLRKKLFAKRMDARVKPAHDGSRQFSHMCEQM